MENRFMRLAIEEAIIAKKSGDVPVGAVIVRDGQVVAAAHNTRETEASAIRHAEISAIEAACKRLQRWRLDDCDLYVTLEPCLMCTGAVVQSRIRRLFFGAYDRERGYIVSNNIVSNNADNSEGLELEYYCGIMEKECARILNDFFDELRG